MAQTTGTSLHIVALETIHCPMPEFKLPPSHSYTLTSYHRTPPPDLYSRIRNATIIITTICRLDATALSAQVTPHLKMVAVMASGTDCVDLSACASRGIGVSNCPGANVEAVAEHAMGLYFATRRNMMPLCRAVVEDEYARSGSLIAKMRVRGRGPRTLREETMGVVGYGAIGKRIAELAKALGMRVIIADRKAARTAANSVGDVNGVLRTPFEELLFQASVLVLCCPLTPDTRNLLSVREFEVMQPDAVVINVSRGGVVDERALLGALKKGQTGEGGGIAGAGIDVFLQEPAGSDNNILVRGAIEKSGLNLVLTPHVAWYAEQTLANLQSLVKQCIEGWVGGVGVNVVA